MQQIVQGRMQDNGINRRIHRIEDPAQPGHEEDKPLVASDAGSPRPRTHWLASPPGYRSGSVLSAEGWVLRVHIGRDRLELFKVGVKVKH